MLSLSGDTRLPSWPEGKLQRGEVGPSSSTCLRLCSLGQVKLPVMEGRATVSSALWEEVKLPCDRVPMDSMATSFHTNCAEVPVSWQAGLATVKLQCSSEPLWPCVSL